MKKRLLPWSLLLLLLVLGFASKEDQDWSVYLGGNDRNHYSTLNQIHAGNLSQLKPAWVYACKDSGQMQTNPLIIDGVLFGISPGNQLFALDASNGKERWVFGQRRSHWASTQRGLSYWKQGKEEALFFSEGPYLWSIDPKTGKPKQGFADKGRLDLRTGLPPIAKDKFLVSNTPGTIYKDLIIMPVRLDENAGAAPGDIRAFHVRTGKLVWTFHTIPYPGEYGYQTFPKDAYKNESIGAANNWAGMALDEKNGLLFVPTGSAAYDFYGANRKGKNLFANCLLALDANTGQRIWHFQAIHHDVWDRDFPSPPNLLTLTLKGKKIEVVAQTSKQGLVYVFERKTGKSLFPISEMPVPTQGLPGESLWSTQPMPKSPKPFARYAHELTENDLNPYSSEREQLKSRFRTYDRRWFAPPSEKGTLLLPGFDGGAEWGGAAVDPEKGIMYINSNEMAWVIEMKEKREKLGDLGANVFQNHCSTCHGPKGLGDVSSGYPSLLGLNKKLNKQQILQTIAQGKGKMPGFPQLNAKETEALLAYIQSDFDPKNTLEGQRIGYQMQGYRKFLDKDGLPGISPPWGTLNALDLSTGNYLWKIPLGYEPALASKGIKNTGVENYGGPLLFKNGLLFIAASKDAHFRAFDAKTGQVLWTYPLPFAAHASPATYMVHGKQYIVLACGGGKLGTPKGNVYMAFALD